MVKRGFRSLCLFLRKCLCSFVLTLILLLFIPEWFDSNSILNTVPPNVLQYMQYKESPTTKINSTLIKYLINKYNQEETVINMDKFGYIKKDTTVLVVQVHKYSDHFKYLLASLYGVTGIQDVLVIFSHLYVDDNVNKLIQSVDCCRVLQIFYPYSVKVYGNEFPGFSENDCPYNMKIRRAEFLNCTGAYTPDIHGRYRHPAKAENKHFWWWTANKVFQYLSYNKTHTGIVVFLQDDVYLIEDFLYMIMYMRNLAQSLPQCEILSMGIDSPLIYDNAYRVEFSTWDPRYHSDVIAFDATVWNTIVAHYDLFCGIDDSSWSRSLLYLSLNRRENKRLKVVYSVIPRVVKTSSCSHGMLGSCNILDNVIKALKITRTLKSNLYPPFLEVYTNIELDDDEYVVFDIAEGEGGWNDPRDKTLCSNMTLQKVRKILLDMKLQFQDY